MKLRRLFGQRWLSALTLLAFVFLILAPASALPEGPTVIHGNIKVLTAGQLQQILQSSSQGIINWNSFGIAPNEVVRIIQPNASSVLLNRVTGMDPSLLQGLLQANGRIFLVNPNGILFGPNSKVDAGSFFATTLGISDQDFLKGNYNFSQNAQGKLAAIVNQGEIRVGDGGFIVLAAPLVHNDGLIVARQGSVNLAATQQATLQLDPQGNFQVIVPDGFKPTFSDPVKNGEAVLLQRGQVTDILSSVIRSGSVLEASSFEDAGAAVIAHNSSGLALNSGQIVVDGNPGQAAGRIRIDSERASVQSPTGVLSAVGHNADAGDIRMLSNGASITAGAVDASATGTGHGGFVELSGRTLKFGSGVKVGSELGHAGTILLDPVDLFIIPGNLSGSIDGSLPTIGNGTGSITETLGDGSINAFTTGNVIINATRDIIYQSSAANINLPAAVNLSITAGRDLTFQSVGATSMLGISAGNISLEAGRDLTLQGRYGVLINATNGDASLTAGRNLSVQYYNPGGGGGSNPRRVMALAATGNVNLTAGNNLVFATNNNVDGLDSAANITTIRSTSGNIVVNAGRDATIGVGLSGTRNTRVGAIGSLTVSPVAISVAEASVFAGNLSIQGANVTLGTNLTATGSANINTTTGDLAIIYGAPNLTFGNTNLSSARNLTIQATAPTGMVNVSSNSLNVTAANDLTIQGRYGVNLTSNTTANLNAGRDLNIQYFNPGGGGGSNPRRVMALTAAGEINLSANNNLVFATNNNVDGLDAAANITTIRSTSGNIVINAGQDAAIGVSLNSTQGANVVAGRNLKITPINISVPEVSQTIAGNLNLRGSNVTINTDLTANSTNITSTVGDLSIIHGSPTLTVGNLNVNSARNLTVQATSPTGMVNISSNSLNLTAANDLTIQGRFGVNLTSNTSANLTAGNDLSVQYFNPGGGGGSNPRRVMALTAAGEINLSANSNLVFATNNNVDFLDSAANLTTIRSTSGNIAITAGQNASIGVGLNSTKNASVVAARNLTIAPINITVAEASPNMAGNLNLRGSNVTINTDINANATNINSTVGDLSIIHGSPTLTVGNLNVNSARNLTVQATSPTGMVNISSNSLNLTAANDLTIQGRFGVNLTSNTSANLTAGNDLSVQYFNPGSGGGSNPLRLMALTANGDINLSAGNNLVFATNNNFDGVNGGGPNTTTIRSTSGNVGLTAGRDASIGVSLNSTKNASVVAGRNLTISPINISVAEASPNMAGNLNLQASNVTINTDITANSTNINSTVGDLAIIHGSPTLTVGNLSLNSARNLTIQATAAIGLVNISANSLNLTAANELTIQGRYGVNLTSNSTANLAAGSNLSVQYFNPGGPGGSNPLRLMALTANGDINLSAGNNLVFATNNNVDGVNGGGPNTTTIRSTSGNVALTAGRDASIGVSINSTKNASVVAGRNLTIAPINISVAEASPKMAGNLNLQANNITLNTDLTVNGTANITTTAGDLAIVHGSPSLTVGNLNLSAARNLTIQATASTGVLGISANSINLNATNDLTIQGRYGVNITSNSTANLAAGSNLSVQYFNPGGPGGSNPLRLMSLTAPGDINLSAGNNLVFATNNNIDGPNGGGPNTTTITSQNGSIAVNAGQDVFLGVSTNSSVNDNLIAGGTIHIGAIGISGPEATTNTSGNLSLAADALNISTATPLSAQGALTLNISSGLNLTSDLNSAQGLTLISNTSITGTGRNLTSSNGVVNLTVYDEGLLSFNNSNISGSNGVAIQNLGNGTAAITASNLTSSQGVQAITAGNGGMTIDGSSLNSTSSNVSLRNSGAGPVVLSNSSVSARNIDVLNSGNGSVSVVNTRFGATNNIIAQNPGGGSVNFTGGNFSAGQSFNLNSSGSGSGQVQFSNSTLNTTTAGLLNLGNGTFNVTNSTFSVTNNLGLRNQAGGSFSFTDGNLSVGQTFNLDSNGSGSVHFGNSTVNATGGNLQNSGGGSLNVTNSTFSISNTLDLRNQGGGNFQVTGGNFSVGQPFGLTSNGGSFQFNNSSVNSSAIDVQNSGGGNFSSQGSRFVSGSSVKFQNQGGTLNLTAANVDAAGGVVLNSTSPANSTVTGSNVRAGTTLNLTSTAGGWNLGGSNFNSVGAISLASQGGSAINVVDSNITTNNGSIDIKSAVNSDVILGNSTRLVSNNGNITVDSGRNLLAGPTSSLRSRNVTLKAAGNVTVGILNASNAAINSTGGNIVVESMSLINGGNISFYTPLGLLENTPVSPTAILTPLQSLTLDVGTAFGNATLTSTYSVVNSSTIDILITAPNDPTRARAADLKTFGGAKPLVRRITNTGAIFLDGVELFVNPIVQQQGGAITRREELDDSLQVELIRQLAQCNLALGNKSGTAYFVDSEDRLQIPYNSDLLSGPFSDYPMAITLEHIVELDPKSILEQAKLDIAVARATNVMNAQEQQEAWEIRYWSNFIERIILWGDDE